MCERDYGNNYSITATVEKQDTDAEKKRKTYTKSVDITLENSLQIKLLYFTFQSRRHSWVHSATSTEHNVFVKRGPGINISRLSERDGS